MPPAHGSSAMDDMSESLVNPAAGCYQLNTTRISACAVCYSVTLGV